MTDTRQVLEEAFEAIFPHPNKYVFDLEADARHYKFTRFLDAEAWTDAALMLIPVRYKDDYEIGPVFSRLGLDYDCADHWGWSDVPALSLVEACLAALRAKEAGDE